MNQDRKWMSLALKEAEKAYRVGEIPIGAVIVLKNKLIARGHNLSVNRTDPTAHAEIIALRQAGQRLKNYRLNDTILYVTVEPCPMCAGAIVWARVKRVVFGCPDPKVGAGGTVFNLLQNKQLNHQVEMVSGVCEEECRRMIQDFFQQKRTRRG